MQRNDLSMMEEDKVGYVIGQIVECRRCGERWALRIERRPKRCPNCTSRYWDVARKGESLSAVPGEKAVDVDETPF